MLNQFLIYILSKVDFNRIIIKKIEREKGLHILTKID